MKLAGVALLSLAAAGCAYPEFAFASRDAREDVVDASTELIDAARDTADTTARPDTVDVEIPEVPVEDTAIADSSMDVAADSADVAPQRDAADAALPCQAGLTMCGGTCVDTQDAEAHCGGCGKACSSSDVCSNGGCRSLTSCAAIKTRFPTLPSGAYNIDPDATGPLTPFRVFCDMSDVGNGWTLALKLDGAKTTFAYDAALWTNDAVLTPTSTDLSETEAKFRSFSEVPVKQLRVRMVDGSPRSLVVDAPATSLKALFSGGFVGTALGRTKWLSLVVDGSLQPFCDAEGINLDYTATLTGPKIRLRIGIVGNQENDCSSPDSFVGFGAKLAEVFYCFGDVDPGVTVGNVGTTKCGAATTRITKAFGFVFVR